MSEAIENLFVEREEGERRSRYVVRLPGGAEAELTYGRGEGNVLVADHTYVPNEFRGRGIAEILVQHLIADAEREGTRILPLCSYVAVQFERHPEWAALRA